MTDTNAAFEAEAIKFSKRIDAAATTLAANNISQERWFRSYWRPAICWLYILLILSDFILAPIATMGFFLITKIEPYVAWSPLTLQGGGLIHMAFGAIIGIYSWNRTTEKISGMPG